MSMQVRLDQYIARHLVNHQKQRLTMLKHLLKKVFADGSDLKKHASTPSSSLFVAHFFCFGISRKMYQVEKLRVSLPRGKGVYTICDNV